MSSSPQLKALGEFFRARRGEISPDTVPAHVVSAAGRRRVTGLRREEVAQLAAVSVDYYTRVEQGRLAPSDQVFALLCRTFALSSEQRAYAEDLLNHARGYVMTVPGREAAHNRLQLLLDQLTELPALVLGPRMDVLAWNGPAATLITDFARLPATERNYVSITFTTPGMRDLYEDWSSVARTCVGILRREAAENPDDPELVGLVGRLSIASNDFRRWWAEHRVAEQDFGAKVMLHPTAGRMRLNWDSFSYAGAARQQLILWSAEAGSPDAHALATLVSASRGAPEA
ncbi:transcriptional regulator [Nocardiopsis terrae]|uniref:Transcriptional regulator with XRE-family HTH domain n=1 Tax=Nocardiopsis terrae TaxID=372655 RepID=A0ABR9HH49_9ACTN|nr:helix-turn-helix transcriptional regulator [Nocardiopsis terrae]MBE1458350.1 transcriptional regulator with XRE-family HTH domain [Nocardiopsis terrae]GHC80974.1 transcriptional regulator [Nocardiopsis terrae]